MAKLTSEELRNELDRQRERERLAFDFQGVRMDMKMVQKSMTRSPLNRIKFVVEYDDGTADVYERTLT